MYVTAEQERSKDFGELPGLNFGLFARLTWALKPSCPVLTSWHHHLLISLRSFHRLMDKAMGQGSDWQGGPWACCSAIKAVYSLLSLSGNLLRVSVTILDPARGYEIKKSQGQRENRRKRCERGKGRVMSCLRPERREEPMDMTDYRQGRGSRPMPRPQLSVMGAGRGMWGTVRGANKKGMSWWKKAEEKKKKRRVRKKKPFKGSCIKMSRFVWLSTPSDVGHSLLNTLRRSHTLET